MRHFVHSFRWLLFSLALLQQSGFAQTADSTLSFYTLVPFDANVNPFKLSVVSDSSIWYTTSEGVYHFDGTHPVKVLDDSFFTHSAPEVLLIQALADTDVWVLGHDAKTWTKAMYHFDGRAWNNISFPQASDDPNDDLVIFNLKMMRTGSRTIGYAVGQDGYVCFYDGKKWKKLEPFCAQSLRALCVRGESDVWAGGRSGSILHFDGSSWRQAVLPSTCTDNYLFDFAFTGDRNGWAAGITGLLHFDGRNWDSVAMALPGRCISVAMSSSNDGWLATANGNLLRYDGNSWNFFRSLSGLGGISVIDLARTKEGSKLFVLSSTGLSASHSGRVPVLSDVSGAANIHLNGGNFLVADFDGNGTPDLASTGFKSFHDRLYSNRGDGFYNETTERLHPISESSGLSESIADIDNNGLPDIFMIKLSNEQQWYANRGTWNFTPHPSPVPPELSVERSVTQFADLDNDGDLDLIYLSARQVAGAKLLTVYYNDGVGNFSPPTEIGRATSSGDITMSFFTADLNNDGLMDIFKYNYSGAAELYLNDGNGAFTEVARDAGIDGTYFDETPSITWACPIDFNCDGALDVFLVSRKGQGTFFMNDGHGRFHPGNSISFDPHGENPVGAFVDIDNDGDQDLFLLGRFYKNESGQLSLFREVTVPHRGAGYFVDIDGDGDNDMLFQSLEERGRIFVYRNGLDPGNVVTLRVEGIRSNSFAIGAHVTLWKEGGLGARTRMDFREVAEPVPLSFSLDTATAYSIDVDFPSGIHRTLEHVKPGRMSLAEFSFPIGTWWDFVYSFRRSFLLSNKLMEALKAIGVLLFIVMLIRISSRWKTRRYIAQPLFLCGLAVLYVLTVHATIRAGLLTSGIASTSGVVLLGVGWLVMSRSIVKRREARYIMHYKLLDQIGEGGMGKVYRARDEHTKGIVALKVLNTALLQDPENRRRLTTEGQILSSFRHPHIVKVFEIGESAERGFIAMEYLPGGTLRQHLERSWPLALPDVKRLSLEVCDGLEEIHRHGIIHRDMKTGNIMLDEQGSIRIMDFGLSKSPLVTTMTTLGTVLGTLGYVAPEQVTSLNVDHRVDIFSMGVILYELLTKKLPFTGENEIAVIHAIFNTQPPLPSALSAQVPRELDAIVMKCLDKNPECRFQTVRELAIALDGDFW